MHYRTWLQKNDVKVGQVRAIDKKYVSCCEIGDHRSYPKRNVIRDHFEIVAILGNTAVIRSLHEPLEDLYLAANVDHIFENTVVISYEPPKRLAKLVQIMGRKEAAQNPSTGEPNGT